MANDKFLTDDARRLAAGWLSAQMPAAIAVSLSLGLPEWDDRLELWRVALVSADHPDAALGEVRIDAAGAIRRAPPPSLVAERLRGIGPNRRRDAGGSRIAFPPIPNKAILGDCRAALAEFPPDSAQLVFTSPPYYNAKPECAEFVDYQSYLDFLGAAFAACSARAGRRAVSDCECIAGAGAARLPQRGQQAAAHSL